MLTYILFYICTTITSPETILSQSNTLNVFLIFQVFKEF